MGKCNVMRFNIFFALTPDVYFESTSQTRFVSISVCRFILLKFDSSDAVTALAAGSSLKCGKKLSRVFSRKISTKNRHPLLLAVTIKDCATLISKLRSPSKAGKTTSGTKTRHTLVPNYEKLFLATVFRSSASPRNNCSEDAQAQFLSFNYYVLLTTPNTP